MLPVRQQRVKMLHKMPRSEMFSLLKAYKDFPLYAMPSDLLRILSFSFAILAVGYLYPPEVLGFYAMASRLLQRPLNRLIIAVRRVYIQQIATMRNRGIPVRQMLLKTTIGLFLVGVLPFSLIILFGEPLAGWILGTKWTTAGRYATVIAPGIWMMFLTPPASATFTVFRKQAILLQLQIVRIFTRIAIFGAVYLFSLGPEKALRMFMIMNVILGGLTIFIALRISSYAGHQPNLEQDHREALRSEESHES
jgi:O-antigen/teichoic acid export membrane protein